RAGNALRRKVQMINRTTNTPVDLTGSLFDGKVSLLDEGATADLNLTVNVIDVLQGKYEFVFSSALSASFQSSNDFFKTKKTYAWRINWTNSLGDPQTQLYGFVFVADGDLP
ncbi:MAG: hypothetical protein ACRDBG_00695, partial [Waterburya sp.]